MKNFKGDICIFYFFWLLLIFFLASQDAYSLSFRLYDTGAKAQAQAGAFTAQANDATSVYYNPGALTTLEGRQVLTGTEFILLETDYMSPTGVSESSDNDWGIVPHLYATTPLGEKWAVGLGVYSLFGLATEYSDKGVFRYEATSSKLDTATVSPVIGYQLTPELSIGGGLDIVLGNLDLRRKVDFGALAGFPGAFDGDFRIDADGEALGFNFGALYKPHPQHQLGLAFHSPVELDLEGTVGLANIPPFMGVGSGVSGALSTELDLPSILRVGYAYRPHEHWKLEFDVEWTNFSSFKRVDLQSRNPLVPSSIIPENHDDAYVLALGTEYALNSSWAVRAGYGHAFESVPESTFSPIIPGADRNFFTAGLGLKCCALSLDIAYQFILFDDRSIDNNVGADVGVSVDGEYESTAHAIVLDIGISF